MFAAADPCHDTVSVLHALIFGADGACVALSAWSALLLLLPFAVAVMLLQKLANLLFFGRQGKAEHPRLRGEIRPRAGQRVAQHLRDEAKAPAPPDTTGH